MTYWPIYDLSNNYVGHAHNSFPGFEFEAHGLKCGWLSAMLEVGRSWNDNKGVDNYHIQNLPLITIHAGQWNMIQDRFAQ